MRLETSRPLDNIFPLGEAELEFLYGRIGQGKSATGTVMTLEALRTGTIVKTSYPIKFNGYDERKIWYYRWLGKLGLKQDFLVVPKENYHFFNYFTGIGILHDWATRWPRLNEDQRRQAFYSWLSNQTDCIIVIDEAQFPFDSYFGTKMDINHRMAILATRHFNRQILLIAQRPTSVHTVARSQVARFHKLEKVFNGWWIIPARFRITEFQDTDSMNSVPKEDRVMVLDEETHQMMETDEYKYAISERRFWGKQKTYESYDSKYLRNGMPSSQPNYAHVIHWRGIWDWVNTSFSTKQKVDTQNINWLNSYLKK